jgi:plasmid stabilization system protein ParE
MTGKKAKTLPVVYAAIARHELDETWRWNEKTYGRRHAVHYVDFLIRRIGVLGTDYQKGQVVSTRPDLRYLPIKLKSRGHGHVVVYGIDERAVSILHIFHTAQDWQTRVSAETE